MVQTYYENGVRAEMRQSGARVPAHAGEYARVERTESRQSKLQRLHERHGHWRHYGALRDERQWLSNRQRYKTRRARRVRAAAAAAIFERGPAHSRRFAPD